VNVALEFGAALVGGHAGVSRSLELHQLPPDLPICLSRAARARAIDSAEK
jgi:hypothetical protein